MSKFKSGIVTAIAPLKINISLGVIFKVLISNSIDLKKILT